MKSVLVIFGVIAVASAQSGAGGGFNLNTQQGIQQFLAMEGINPSSIVTSNCIANGNPCSPSGGQQCCLSPVFSCQASSTGNVCLVVPAHVNHIPYIKQIVATEGITTQNPIL